MSPQTAYETVLSTIRVLSPEILLLLAALAMMTLAPFLRWPRRTWFLVSMGALAASFLVLLIISGVETPAFAAVALNDALSFYGRIVVLLSGLVLVALAHEEPGDEWAGEFFGSLLIMNAGTMLVITANELVFLFVGLELVSMPTYLLLYLSRRSLATQESAVKYFFLSIFASGMMLFGLTYLYGMSGLSNLKAIAACSRFLPALPNPELGLIAIVFILAGLSFRVVAVPFHFYAPDVYEGSPTVIAALLSWIPKAVGFAAMVRVLTAVFSVSGAEDPLVAKAIWICWIVAAVTMTLGNTMGLLQSNLKRLLAYSSIAHAGYLMIGVTVAFVNGPHSGTFYYGTESIFFYLAVYSLMTLGAFGGILALTTRGRPVETIDELAGLGVTRPLPALALAVCLMSLSGFPPLAGFWAKLEIFASAFVASPEHKGPLVVLAIIGVLNAAAGAYYYLWIVVVMYLKPARNEVQTTGGVPVALAVAVCAVGTVLIGLFPGPINRASHAAALAAVHHELPLNSTASAQPPVEQSTELLEARN